MLDDHDDERTDSPFLIDIEKARRESKRTRARVFQ